MTHQGTIHYRDDARLRELELEEAQYQRKVAEKQEWENKKKSAWKRFFIICASSLLFCLVAGIIMAANNGTPELIYIIGLIAPMFFPFKYIENQKSAHKWLCYFLWVFVLYFCYTLVLIPFGIFNNMAG